MSWYIRERNCINQPKIKNSWVENIFKGNKDVCKKIYDLITEHNNENNIPCVLAFDGFIGAEWEPIINSVEELLAKRDLKIEKININNFYKSLEDINEFQKTYLTDDPSFGFVCEKGRLKHLLNLNKIKDLRKRIKSLKKKDLSKCKLSAIICYGIGSAIPEIIKLCDNVFYFDLNRQTLMSKVFKNEVVPLGSLKPAPIWWKIIYYIYYPILLKHKSFVLKHMDWIIDCNNFNELKLISREIYDDIISSLKEYPLKFTGICMPGSWGGYKFKEYFDLKELSNCAWDKEIEGMDSNFLVEVGKNTILSFPFWNLYSKYSNEIIGPYCTKKFPGNFPLVIAIDDGYFPKPVSHERRAMPVHLHPDHKYTRKNFNESMGRYETYYIVEAYENANTMLGFKNDVNIDDFKRKILESDEKKQKFDWSKYIKTWPSKEGDLYLIPAGTVHGTGGNQMILEMDTGPSKQETEYSFFIYDYLRNTWDDDKKEMTGKPSNLQIKHGFAQCRWNRNENWVKNHALSKTKIIASGNGWSKEQFSSYYSMPFLIERLNFKERVKNDTLGRFCHAICLTKGNRVIVRSTENQELQIELEYIQLALIPAAFGEYECINIGNTEQCTIVIERWKKG